MVGCTQVASTWAMNSRQEKKQQAKQTVARGTDVSGYVVKKNDGVIAVWQKRWFVLPSDNVIPSCAPGDSPVIAAKLLRALRC